MLSKSSNWNGAFKVFRYRRHPAIEAIIKKGKVVLFQFGFTL